ncbi:MAG: META domain-containing protein [Saprospiraceae bacterium]
MKKILFVIALISSCLIACKSTRNAAQTNAPADPAQLNGTWELNYITTSRVPFKDLYPDKKPTITFNVADTKINGNTGCNTFIGSFSVNGTTIDLSSPLALSRMACPGVGENVFVESLKKVNTYSIDRKILSLMEDGTETMRFERK